MPQFSNQPPLPDQAPLPAVVEPSGLFSAAAPVVATQALVAGADLLWPQESESLGAVSRHRAHQFALGRYSARRALARLGEPPAAIGVGDKRQPVWPAGVVGAITHTNGLVAAVVAYERDCHGVGIDAEPNQPLPPKVVRRIIRPEEAAQLSHCGPFHVDRLIFSVKESIYKAWYPLAHQWLGFFDAIVTLQMDEQRFTAKILKEGPFEEANGRFLLLDGFIVTGVELSARARKVESMDGSSLTDQGPYPQG